MQNAILGSATCNRAVKPRTLGYGVSIFGSGLKQSIENRRFWTLKGTGFKVRAVHPHQKLLGVPRRGDVGETLATLPQPSVQMSTHFTKVSLVFIMKVHIYHLLIKLGGNIGFQVSDRQCCPMTIFFS